MRQRYVVVSTAQVRVQGVDMEVTVVVVEPYTLLAVVGHPASVLLPLRHEALLLLTQKVQLLQKVL